jgi:flagellar M-ring protein FliF
MTNITNLVKSAMGFDQSRGDQLQVTNMEFARVDAGEIAPADKPLLGLEPAYWFKIIEAAIMCVTALLIGLFVGRPLIARMFAPNPPAGMGVAQLGGPAPVAGALPAPPGAAPAAGGEASAAGPAALPAPGPGIDISGIEGKVRESSVKKIGEVVSAHPEEALAIIRTWLHQPV